LAFRLCRAGFLFGEVTATYMLLPDEPGHCRLLVKIPMRHSRRLPALRLRHAAMPWLDLLMMRRPPDEHRSPARTGSTGVGGRRWSADETRGERVGEG